MDKTTQILSALFGVAIVLMLAPSVFALNRGKILRNIALWVAIFLGLAVAYKTVGPGKEGLPLMDGQTSSQESNGSANDAEDPDKSTTPTLREEDGFSPPRE